MENEVTINAIGDIAFIGTVAKNIQTYGLNHPFEHVTDALKNADILFGNLEMPFCLEEDIVSDPNRSTKFWTSTKHIGLLSGFNIVSLANNHIGEHGEKGIDTTIKVLKENKIEHVGAGKNLEEARRESIIERNGVKVGFLAYARSDDKAGPDKAGACPLDRDIIFDDIKKLKEKVDIVIVSLHFGMMYIEYPNDEEKKLAHEIINCGADAIFGHHPHVLRGFKKYKNSVIAFSLGEFIFDRKAGLWYSKLGRKERRESAILKCRFKKGVGLVDYKIVPVYLNDDYQPTIPTGTHKDEITSRINKLTEGIDKGDAAFYESAGPNMVSYETNALLFHLKKGNIAYPLKKLLKVRKRHINLLLGAIRNIFVKKMP